MSMAQKMAPEAPTPEVGAKLLEGTLKALVMLGVTMEEIEAVIMEVQVNGWDPISS